VSIVDEIEDVVRRTREDASEALGRLVGRAAKPVFEHMRRHRPILKAGGYVVVTLAEDVRAVLGDHEHFTVDLYEPKMEAITGPFFLGLDDTPLARHDEAAMQAAVRPDDMAAIGTLVLEAARGQVVAANGSIDVVSELADPVLDRAIAEYFGTPGPDMPTQLRWARNLFEDIFINVTNDEKTHARALADAAEMRPHLDRLIDERKALSDGPDDVLGRLLRAGELHDIAIRHNLIGLIVGWIPTVSKALALAVEELLHRERELEGAQRAARDGDLELVAAYVWEALRFRPQNWGLLRKCPGGHVIAPGTERETSVPAGATVVAATLSAMNDETEVDAPDEFRTDRPYSTYMHFGHGLHRCFGEPINRVQLPALMTALLEGGPIERDGDMEWEGPYPSSLRVRL
jgi:cytochrome P450